MSENISIIEPTKQLSFSPVLMKRAATYYSTVRSVFYDLGVFILV